MKALIRFFAWLAAVVLSVMFLFHTMGAMLVHDDAEILLRAPACPISAKVDEHGTCLVHGSVSRSFATSEVVVTLGDKSELWIQQKDLLGYSHPDGSVRYRPFGKFFALMVGVLILLAMGWMLMGAPLPPRPRPTQNSPRR